MRTSVANFPKEHWRQIWSNNPQERLNREPTSLVATTEGLPLTNPVLFENGKGRAFKLAGTDGSPATDIDSTKVSVGPSSNPEVTVRGLFVSTDSFLISLSSEKEGGLSTQFDVLYSGHLVQTILATEVLPARHLALEGGGVVTGPVTFTYGSAKRFHFVDDSGQRPRRS